MTSWVPIIRASGSIGSIIPYTHTTVKHQKLERSARFELATTCLEGRRSDRTELTPQNCANTAEDGRNRTPGPFRLAPLSRRALHPRQHRLPKLVENVGFDALVARKAPDQAICLQSKSGCPSPFPKSGRQSRSQTGVERFCRPSHCLSATWRNLYSKNIGLPPCSESNGEPERHVMFATKHRRN